MASYKAPLREIQFVLHDVLDIEQLAALPDFADMVGRETVDGVVEEAAKLIEEKIAPLSARGDAQGCRWEQGEVRVPEGYADAYKLYWQGGWVGLSSSPEFGGQGLPYTLSKVVEEMLCSANVGFALYPGLTSSCFEAIEANGSEAIKRTYLPKLATGEWTGTMCMTEPQAGSDLAAVKTKAIPQGDGSFLIEGGKIFITSGEHRMADNIIHFVLARLPDSPPGIKGLSTFVVPKFFVKPDGTPGERNKVRCVSIEHKMGMHGSVTCTMAFEGARGWMVGQPNQGIQNMFVMMNLARIMVGFQGLGQCELATQNAIRYAQERRQGKAFNNGDAIIEHPDVRRMLLTMKALTEAGRVLAYETALNVDIAAHHTDAAAREAAQDWVELTTPLVKSFLTDAAFDLGSMAVQVYGGHGFIREHGVEQIVRDSKILALYEGTNGIQAMDLVRRKLMLHNGRLAQRFFERVRKDLALAGADGRDLAFLERPLSQALDAVETTTRWLQESFKTNPNDAGFGAVDFLKAFSLTALGYNWLRMVKAAAKQPDAGLRKAKRITAEFFAARLLTQVPTLCANVRQNADSLMQLEAEQF
ncbi:MAG: acyl-CoA dehydrogenase C-terminal domain-containing protein [Gammaproteobacteria bacterium]|nr:acyl-CoA dehydrogenase C-terminal domain-containing protein [Gammaproteobacteria bacterium]